jgi:hypothetical protein
MLGVIHFDLHYLELYQIDQEKRERNLNIFLAIASSGSIAAWAIWDKWSMIWPSIIALSQVVNVIRPYLPYQQRIKGISAAIRELHEIALDAENKWFAISEGQMTNEEIHEEFIRLKQRGVKILSNHFGPSPLPQRRAFIRESEQQAEAYLRSTYGVAK